MVDLVYEYPAAWTYSDPTKLVLWDLMSSALFVHFVLPFCSNSWIVKPNEDSAWALGACKQLSHNLLSSLLSQAKAHPYPQ